MTSTEPLGGLINIAKGKKPETVRLSPEGPPRRVIQINDLRSEPPQRFTSDSRGVEALPTDVLIAWDGANAGTVGWGLEGYIGSTIARLRPKNSAKVFTPYLGRFLASQFGTLNRGTTGATIPHVDGHRLARLPVPLPPESEQRRIAAILDKADELGRKREESVRQMDELLRSTFLEMFGDPVSNPKGWERVSIGQVSARVTKGESPNWQGFGYEVEGVRFVTSENVRWGALDFPTIKRIPEPFHRKLLRSQLRQGDLLINLVGASVGRAALVTKEILPANINQAVAVVSLNQRRVLPSFVLQQVLTDSVQRKLLGNIVESARANISLTNVSDLPLIAPPIDLQAAWNRFLELQLGVERLRSSSRKHFSDLFQSLLHRAFRGEL